MPLKIAICGGGIGGLCLAVVLKKFASKDLHVDIYEAGSKFAETGAGITAWERTRTILRRMGMAETFDSRATSVPVVFRKSDTQEPFDFHDFIVPNGSVGLPRSEMLNIMVEQLTPETTPFLRTHFARKLDTYEQDTDGVTLRFADGSSARADVLIGADGIGSPTRNTMCAGLENTLHNTNPQNAEDLLKVPRPSWTGTYAYRALLDREKLRTAAPHNIMLDKTVIWFGRGRHVVSYPISLARINVVFFNTDANGLGKPLSGPPVTASSKDEVSDIFSNFEPDLHVAIDRIEEVSKFAVSHVRGLPHYVDRRVALLGDSAHAMSPHFTAGAGQAIEDAYILGRLLAHAQVTNAGVPAALKIYDNIRRPVANDAVERSLRLGGMYEFQPDTLPEGTDLEKLCAGDPRELGALAEAMQDMYQFHWAELPERDWQRAEEMLREHSDHV